MPDDPSNPGSSGRGAQLRTKPFDDDSNSLREALQRELRKSVAPSLAVILGPDVGTRIPLVRSVDVGRDPSCELPLRDENVSWRHVRVEDRGNGDWAVVDLGSTNGTILDGQPCKNAPLVPGNRIFVGKTVIEMQQDALRDIQNQELERLLSIDDLSGLWVKRRFDAQLATSVAAVLAGSVPALSVIVMDMDGVKGINDTHGHHMGAFVIGSAGRVIGKGMEGRGFATRFGGDEFAAALPGVGKDAAVGVAEELRAAVVAHVYEKDGLRVYPGLSCGVATAPTDGLDGPEALFRAADQAMYRAKRAGKNRVAT
ncbi:MAG TPA: diguanylate cyclase [Polyangiaceae bacterium]|jgi:diguanylate cyclase (GGDEF)-like protein